MNSPTLLVPIVAITFGCLVPLLMAWLILWYGAKRHALVYQTALKLAESGQPIPVELFRAPDELRGDLRRGVVLLMIGVGLSIALNEISIPWTFGLIPTLMGVGYLLVWKIESLRAR